VTAQMRLGERLPAGPSPRTNRRPSHGHVPTKGRLERIAGYSLQQARAQPVQCAPRQGRRRHRGVGRGHRAAHPLAEPHRPAGAGRQWRRDRHVRGAGGRPALPGAGAAGEAEAPRPHRAGPVHHPHRGHRRGGQPRRECPAGPAASARPVPGVPGAAREGPVGGGNRGGILRVGPCRAPAAAPRLCVAEAARCLRRGWHDARPADGVHRQSRPYATAGGLGGRAALADQAALSDPPAADGGRRARVRQAGAVCRHHRVRGRGRRRAARPVRVRRRRLAARTGTARPARRRKARSRGRGRPRRGMEVGRGRPRLPLRPYLRPAPTERQGGAADEEGGQSARCSQGGARQAGEGVRGRRGDPG
jgi:hypothetical protein